MKRSRPANPIRKWKLRNGLTYAQVAEALGISHDYARKLGAGLICHVSVVRAREIERRTKGEITFRALMRWAEE